MKNIKTIALFALLAGIHNTTYSWEWPWSSKEQPKQEEVSMINKILEHMKANKMCYAIGGGASLLALTAFLAYYLTSNQDDGQNTDA